MRRPLAGLCCAVCCTLGGGVEDATLTNITDELIDRDRSPKVPDPEPTPRHPRSAADRFCLFSRAGIAGSGCAHAAATPGRRPRTGAAPRARRSAIAWGVVGRAILVSNNYITPEEGAYAFETPCATTALHSGYIPIPGAMVTDLVRTQPVV